MNNPYIHYYLNQQQGDGMPVFRGSPWQRGYGQTGYGLGGLFRSVARAVMPLVKSGAKALGKIALNAGANVLGDVASGHNLKDAIKSRGKEAVNVARGKAINRLQTYAQTGRGRRTNKKRKASSSATRSRQTKKRKTTNKRKASRGRQSRKRTAKKRKISTSRTRQTKKRKTVRASNIFG